jgi:site-specific recombinase XerD
LSSIFQPEPPFRTLALEWLAETAHRPSWRKEIDRLLGKELQRLPRRPTRRDISALLSSIPHASVRSHCFRITAAIYRWGVATGRCEQDPTQGLSCVGPPARQRVLSLPEIKTVWAATGDGTDYSRIVRLLILSGARAREIGGLRWEEIGDDRITIPAGRMKGHRGHMIPLGPASVSVLPRQRPGRPYVFGRRRASGFGGWSKGKACLPSLTEPWVLHDLRRSFATHAVELGLGDPDLVELALGHVRPGIRGVYQRSQQWPERIALASRWADILGGLSNFVGPLARGPHPHGEVGPM